jgi:monothiol glutaredoxin
MKTEEKIQKQISENPIMIYMKGTPDNPECGFSAKAASILKQTGAPFGYLNVLQSPFIMERLPAFSDFPTFPQVFINGELIGGSDIVEDMFNSGDLQKMISATSTAG